MKRKRILLVEDEVKVQDYNKYLLEKEGFAAETAMTLAEARTAAERQTPDIIVLDIGMPDGSGLDFLREFKQTSNIPVLLLTGYNKNEDVLAGFERGCNDYLKKPYAFPELLARIKTF